MYMVVCIQYIYIESAFTYIIDTYSIIFTFSFIYTDIWIMCPVIPPVVSWTRLDMSLSVNAFCRLLLTNTFALAYDVATSRVICL